MSMTVLLLMTSLSLGAGEVSHAWLKSPDVGLLDEFFAHPVDSLDVREVGDAQLNRAIDLLKHKSAVSLDEARCRYFGLEDACQGVYLIRALQSAPGGSFSVFVADRSAYVIYEHLGPFREIKPRPLIIRSTANVRNTYVAVHSIE